MRKKVYIAIVIIFGSHVLIMTMNAIEYDDPTVVFATGLGGVLPFYLVVLLVVITIFALIDYLSRGVITPTPKLNKTSKLTRSQVESADFNLLIQLAEDAYSRNDFEESKRLFSQAIALGIQCSDTDFARGRLRDIDEILSR